MSELLDELVSRSLSLGASFAECRFEKRFSTSITVVNGVVEKLSCGVDSGYGLRVLVGGALGFASASELAAGGLADSAVDSARALSLRVEEGVALADVPVAKANFKAPCRESPDAVELGDKVELCKRACEAAMSVDGRVKSVTVRLADEVDYRALCTSEGAWVEQTIPRVLLSIEVVAAEAGNLGYYRGRVGAAMGYEFLAEEKVTALAEDCAKRAVRMLEAERTPAGRFTVLCDPELTGVLIHEAFGHACEADGVVAGSSILKGRLGDKVASELVSAYDDPTIEGSWGWVPYDDEGVKGERKALLREGVLASYITNRESAAKLGLKPNGGARAQSYAHPPIVRMSNTFVAPGDWSFEEMVEDIEYGVYLLGSRGGQVEPGKGVFQFNAQEAYLIERGEVTKPLRDASLSGLILETLLNVDAVGRDFKLSPGYCGKDGQVVPASTGGPTIRVRNAVVGGAR